MLFALLETDQNRFFAGVGRPELQARYDALCPPDVHQPYKRVPDELTEAFIRKSPGIFVEKIDWIHPSCRDLAIDELSEHAHDRQQFLSNCSETGLALATSLAGGAKGLRQLPLLQTESDWKHFTVRAQQLIQEKPSVLRVIWNSYQALRKQADQEAPLRGAVARVAHIIKEDLTANAAQKLGQLGYSDSDSLDTFFDICSELEIAPEIDFTEAWADCSEDVKRWVEDPVVIWQHDGVPGRVANFLRILNKFQPSFVAEPDVRQQLNDMLASILERATVEENSSYDSPKDADEAAERADGFDGLHKSFEKLAAVPVWAEEQRKSLNQCAVHFSGEADSLREGLPSEPESDDSRYERPTSDDVNIIELFHDL
jgi:hypothetical protein